MTFLEELPRNFIYEGGTAVCQASLVNLRHGHLKLSFALVRFKEDHRKFAQWPGIGQRPFSAAPGEYDHRSNTVIEAP